MSDNTNHTNTNKGKSLSKTKSGAPSASVRAAMDRIDKNAKTIKLSRSLRPAS
jgi:hypothetical protein